MSKVLLVSDDQQCNSSSTAAGRLSDHYIYLNISSDLNSIIHKSCKLAKSFVSFSFFFCGIIISCNMATSDKHACINSYMSKASFGNYTYTHTRSQFSSHLIKSKIKFAHCRLDQRASKIIKIDLWITVPIFFCFSYLALLLSKCSPSAQLTAFLSIFSFFCLPKLISLIWYEIKWKMEKNRQSSWGPIIYFRRSCGLTFNCP